MVNIIYRGVKGSPLTMSEADTNLALLLTNLSGSNINIVGAISGNNNLVTNEVTGSFITTSSFNEFTSSLLTSSLFNGNFIPTMSISDTSISASISSSYYYLDTTRSNVTVHLPNVNQNLGAVYHLLN